MKFKVTSSFGKKKLLLGVRTFGIVAVFDLSLADLAIYLSCGSLAGGECSSICSQQMLEKAFIL